MTNAGQKHVDLVISVAPTPWVGALVERAMTMEGSRASHVAVTSPADVLGLLAISSRPRSEAWIVVLVDVEACVLDELEVVPLSTNATCMIVAVHRAELSPDRAQWVLSAGGVSMRCTGSADADAGSLWTLTFGRVWPPTGGCPASGDPNELVFLCHASEDKNRVRQLYSQLTRRGIACWIDEVDLIAGQNWEAMIRQALRRCSRVVVCLSGNVLAKRGYVQKELRLAIDESLRQPADSVFLIPVRFEDCEIPDALAHLHAIDLFGRPALDRLVAAITFRPDGQQPR